MTTTKLNEVELGSGVPMNFHISDEVCETARKAAVNTNIGGSLGKIRALIASGLEQLSIAPSATDYESRWIAATEACAYALNERDIARREARAWEHETLAQNDQVVALRAEIIRLHNLLGRAGVPFVDPAVQPQAKEFPARALRGVAMRVGIVVPGDGRP